jgi:hypothetical protein
VITPSVYELDENAERLLRLDQIQRDSFRHTCGSEPQPYCPRCAVVALMATRKETARLAEFQADYARQLEAKDEELDRACALLLDIEGTILAYWTDPPQNLLERHRVEIREFLGDWSRQPSPAPGRDESRGEA